MSFKNSITKNKNRNAVKTVIMIINLNSSKFCGYSFKIKGLIKGLRAGYTFQCQVGLSDTEQSVMFWKKQPESCVIVIV